ncbi:hypothetical protein K443DRAFT_681663 [Laccaria amethystina LaAM-08-1]|uniref:Uncharacterized protein n=1 Tax=Laccaria amethystina LaAM-08-1 TaxID=1095629 RepID=A0A0C9X7D5_9AGAR|nr:hypothetical protein K443DRAFT_681663 [Laccaria amethystina LaAM-08-1]
MPIRSRKAPHILGHCRPPDHKRKLQSDIWRVGITAISPLVLVHRSCVGVVGGTRKDGTIMTHTTRPLAFLHALTHEGNFMVEAFERTCLRTQPVDPTSTLC